ncbi:MAG TPA: hypothetical protein VGV35_10630 [Bryobacteraceae bacterium]|nr:hypothetical protein [Bryobacteraceae bacterium]
MNDLWAKAEKGMIGGLRQFQRQELGGALAKSTIFYPFGGPDALTAAICFPNNPSYVLVGLEPPGTLPSPDAFAKKDLAHYLGRFRASLSSELGRSFFITHEMDQDFRGQVTDGLLLPILHLLVRTQHIILGVRFVRLDEQGRIVQREDSGKFANKGIEIEFLSDSNPTAQTLYYFAVDLSDERLQDNKPFLAYASRLQGATTLLKATSYMTHRADFSIIRDLVLANSSVVLQDDSGIPFRWFPPALWNVRLYGAYNHPYGSFRGLAQADLRNAYLSSNPKPLKFAIGYGYARIPSNLLLARRVPGPDRGGRKDPIPVGTQP